MTGGSGSSTENYVVRLTIDPVIIHAIELLGTGPNLGSKLTDILKALLTDRLEDINARILECQAEGLKNVDGEEVDVDVSKRSIAVQQQLIALRQLLSTKMAPLPEKQEGDNQSSNISLNLAQFAALQALGNKKTRVIDLDLGEILLDLGNMKLAQLNARIAKELAGTDAKPVALENPNPALLQQKDFLSLLKDLEAVAEKMAARSRRICMIQGGIKVLTDTCATILQVPVSEVQERVEKLLQKEQSVMNALSYQVLYDEFKQNMKDFDVIAQQVSLERKPTPQLGKSQIPTLFKKKTRKKAASRQKKAPKEDIPHLERPPPIAISDTTVIDNLTSDPISIGDLLTKMHVVDISDARWLQIQLKELEKDNKILVTTIRGKKHYSIG